MGTVFVTVVFGLAVLWGMFWFVRIAVRAGVNDALEMNRALFDGGAGASSGPPDNVPDDQP